MIYSTVEGLIFKRFQVFGEYIPSIKSIESVLNDRQNKAAKLDFQTLSNQICEFYEEQCKNDYPDDSPENKQKIMMIDLFRQEWGHTEAICKLIKYDFYQLIKSRYIVYWYHSVAGNFSGGNPQSVIRKSKPPKGYMDSILRLRQYPDFVNAEGYLNDFSESLNSAISNGDKEVSTLQNDLENIRIDLAKIEAKSRRDRSKVISFYCKYCQSYHTFDVFKVRQTCGSSECEKKLDAQMKKAARALKSSNFIAAYDGKPKRCRECKYKRVVNVERLCKNCFLESV